MAPTGAVILSTAGGGAIGERTPTGLQSALELARRRRLVALLNAGACLAILCAMVRLGMAGGFTPIDLLLILCAALAVPWSVLGFWNAMLGLWLLHVRRDGFREAAPFACGDLGNVMPRVRTAVAMTLRNEDPARAFARLRAMKRSLDATGCGALFDYWMLSDTSREDVARAEEAACAAWQVLEGPDAGKLFYRRRADNVGFKAGNLRDFCARHGSAYEFLLVLDADSYMSGETVLRMVRIGAAHPRIGILQSLVVGLPAASAFARLFQFGMRHGMRPYTMGSAWWAGDCGQFWGHNALVRIAPFLAHCALPILPGRPPLGGPILSHDQVEAVLMRRAGYEVRVLPVESGSYEDHPPTLIDFARRDLRWCQGNMQYWRLLGLPGLKPMSRFQLLWAILMFLGLPAWTLMILLAALKPLDGIDPSTYPVGLAIAVYLALLFFHFAPKLAGFLDVALTSGGLRRYGGSLRFAAGCLAELAASLCTGAATSLGTSLFMLGLPFGLSVGWGAQRRDAHALSWMEAARRFWLPTLFGLAVLALLAVLAPGMIPWALPLGAGYLLTIPFAVASASPTFARFLIRMRLCAMPEEIDQPQEIGLLARARAEEGLTVCRAQFGSEAA